MRTSKRQSCPTLPALEQTVEDLFTVRNFGGRGSAYADIIHGV
jgi:hypothetical protein